MRTDTKTCSPTEDQPQGEWITRLKIRVYPYLSKVYGLFGWLQPPLLGRFVS